jgi:hypothetical protein
LHLSALVVEIIIVTLHRKRIRKIDRETII